LTPAYADSSEAGDDDDADAEYVQCIRVWGIAKHDKVDAVVDEIVAALRAGAAAARAVRLVRVGSSADSPLKRDDVHPRKYRRLDDGAPPVDGERLLKPAADMSVASELLPRVFTVANSDLARAVLSMPGCDDADWPLHVDQAERTLIKLPFDAPVLLLGRSGTGKTTVAWLRMWRLFRAGVSRFVFITASSELRDRVLSLFNRQRRGAGMAVPPDAGTAPASLADCPAERWPLFLTTSEWLRLADGACETPYFKRTPSGELVSPQLAPPAWRADALAGGPRTDIDYDEFRRAFWPQLRVTLAGLKHLAVARDFGDAAAPAVWREFCTFVKGRAAAADMPNGVLSRAAYLALPAKEAPTFAGDESRSLLYTLFERYRVLSAGRYDVADVVMSVLRQQRAAPMGSGAAALDHVFIDEVQDLLQTEILLLTLAVSHPGALFLAGDTAQTVASGCVPSKWLSRAACAC
jgi:hypothetical protein